MSPNRTYLLEEELPFRFCPGCTHGTALESLAAALEQAAPDRASTVAVTDIGCVGLADRYLDMSTFHGLHGRSIAYAMGLKLARPELRVVNLIGDGGIGIGAGHLVAAARRNVGVCVVVFNNFNFGFTGGQQSATTFTGSLTATSPDGNRERPLDICALARAAGATFVARVSGFDKDLPDVLAQAIAHPGFALVDVWEVCTAHFTKANHFQKTRLQQALEKTDQGVLACDVEPEFAAALHAGVAPEPGFDPLARFVVARTPGETPGLDRLHGVVVAGSAGMKIGPAASLLARAAVMSGAYAAQLDECPITVLTGCAISDVLVSPRPVEHLDCDPPDVVIALSDEGYERFQRRGRRPGRVYRLHGVASRAEGEVELPDARGVRREHLALYAISQVLAREGWLPVERFREAVAAFGRPEAREAAGVAAVTG